MSSKRKIKNVGLDITKVPTSRLPTSFDNAAYVCINTYEGTNLSLGDGTMNDGYNISKALKTLGFVIYYIVNPKKANYLEKLAYFFKNTKGHLSVFYAGHGTYERDLNGDEQDGNDEALVFVDGNVIDDTLANSLSENKNPDSKITFITDCCHSGSIWDLQSKTMKDRPLPVNVVSISAASDKQTSKQTVVERMEQGMFSYHFRKTVMANKTITPNELKKALAKNLRTYGQTVTLASTSDGLLDQPIF